MKSEQEIKDWIDSREVLTRRDLARFMYESKLRPGTKSRPKFYRMWDYVLETKDWNKLKEYLTSKHSEGGKKNRDQDKFNAYKKAYNSDIRIRTYGKRLSQKILKLHHNLELGTSTINRYKKCLQKAS